MDDKFYDRRLLIIIITLLISLVYVLRLIDLQLMTPIYKQRANNNAYYIKPIYPERGVIKDRNGVILVSNTPTYDLMVVVKQIQNLDTLALADLLETDKAFLLKRFQEIKTSRGYSPYVPQMFISKIDERVVGKFKEQLYKYKGFILQNRSVRKYEYHHAAGILGYLSEANMSDLNKDKELLLGDYIGKSGVEKTYEAHLRGIKGKEILLRDSRGHIKGKYNYGNNDVKPQDGRDITLTIDTALQSFGEALMNGKRGAIVAIEPKTGQILAMVDAPSYDPEMLSIGSIGSSMKILKNIKGNPLYHRSIMGVYPPGSTFKLSQAAIFLKEGVLNPHTSLSCYHGYPPLGNRPKCHSHQSPISLIPAIATSCNSYFSYGLHFLLDGNKYKNAGDALEVWKDWIVKMGFGYKLDVDLPGEKRGYIPNKSVYDKVYKKRWNGHTIISIAIGQGEILATPLQIANLGAVIANKGYFYTPHVVKDISGAELDSIYTTKRQTNIEPEIWDYVTEGMYNAVVGGTCRAANFDPFNIKVCGKTGTAQNPHGKDHSAFLGFAPKENPEIVVAVYIENGGFGAVFGVPIGRLMMEYYLKKGVLSESSKAIENSIKNKHIIYFNEK